MKYNLKLLIVLCILTLSGINSSNAQTYVKLNGLYALVGVINPAVEFAISPKSTIQTEIVYSPWSIKDDGVKKPMKFGIFMNEYRRYFKEHNKGWYLGANIGMMGFKMSKPTFNGGKIGLQDRYTKGYGVMVGLCGGFQHKFKERWLIDAYFGYSFMSSWYNGYNIDGTIDMHPNRPVQPEKPDPFNGSSEWLPNKIGVSIGYLIFNPDRKKERRNR